MSEYPKNRTDLIIRESITEDIKILINIGMKYRGLEKIEEFKDSLNTIIRLLKEI